MTASVIDGKAFAAKVRGLVAAHVARLKEENGIQPGLAVVVVGEDPASQVYVRNKHASTVEVGMASFEHRLDAGTSEGDLLALIDTLNADPKVHGILVQLPLPGHLNSELVINRIDPAKDVAGFHISNVGLLGTGAKARVVGTFEIVLLRNAEPGVYSYVNKENSEELVEYHLVGPEDGEVRMAEQISLAAWRALGGRDGGRLRGIDPGQLFNGDDIREGAHPLAAVFGVDGHSQKPHLPHFLRQLDGKFFFAVEFKNFRLDFALGKFTDRFAQEILFF